MPEGDLIGRIEADLITNAEIEDRDDCRCSWDASPYPGTLLRRYPLAGGCPIHWRIELDRARTTARLATCMARLEARRRRTWWPPARRRIGRRLAEMSARWMVVGDPGDAHVVTRRRRHG